MTRIVSTSPAPRPLANERGLALVIVLAVVALLTILVTEFTFNTQLDQHRTRNAVHALQAQLLARSGRPPAGKLSPTAGNFSPATALSPL